MALLTISGTDRTETVIIDDKEYSLTCFDDFSPSDQFHMKKIGTRIVALVDIDDPTEEEITEIQDASDGLFERVAGEIPDEVRKKLKPGARQRIVTAFFLALARETGREAAELSSQSGQGKRSPSSSDSTEEAPSTG